METLSYGYKKPETNDKGPTVFPALQNNIQQINDHDHDGSNSAKLTATSVVSVSATIPLGSWVAFGPTGHYRQQVTLPAGFSYDTVNMGFRLTNGTQIYPTVEKISATQYYVYTIDNTIDFKALYGG